MLGVLWVRHRMGTSCSGEGIIYGASSTWMEAAEEVGIHLETYWSEFDEVVS